MDLPPSAFPAARGQALMANALAKIGGNRHGGSGARGHFIDKKASGILNFIN